LAYTCASLLITDGPALGAKYCGPPGPLNRNVAAPATGAHVNESGVQVPVWVGAVAPAP